MVNSGVVAAIRVSDVRCDPCGAVYFNEINMID